MYGKRMLDIQQTLDMPTADFGIMNINSPPPNHLTLHETPTKIKMPHAEP